MDNQDTQDTSGCEPEVFNWLVNESPDDLYEAALVGFPLDAICDAARSGLTVMPTTEREIRARRRATFVRHDLHPDRHPEKAFVATRVNVAVDRMIALRRAA